jgi:hypothetical protein
MTSSTKGRMPDFLVIGTQKAGTTWLMRKLDARRDVYMAPRQLHYFDREYQRGIDWYRAQSLAAAPDQLVGEKTTEYFDTATIDTVAPRFAETCPDAKFIVILRNPVERAWSALIHHVNAGLVTLPRDPQQAVFDQTPRSCQDNNHFRFIERGFYACQLRILFDHVDPSRVLVLVFEEDIVADPEAGWAKVCGFLDLPVAELVAGNQPENRVRLSPLACRAAFRVRRIPRARGILRRIDRLLGLKPWTPKMSEDTRTRLQKIYEAPNRELFALLGRDIPSWSASQ